MHQSSAHVLAFMAVEAVRRDVTDPRKRHRVAPDSIARPGIVRRLLDRLGGPAVLREPGFAASSGWLDGVVPSLSGYPLAR
jgi:hypothetical protein